MEPVDVTDIVNIVNSFKNNKAPGADEVKPKLLQLALPFIAEPLKYIINLPFITGTVPKSLKVAKVIPLFEKGDKSSPCNYFSYFIIECI